MKYSRSLDFVLASLRQASAGKMETAAACFERALKSPDLKATLASLEKQQAEAFDAVQKANPTVASLFAEIAAKKKKKATKAKGKPFGGKKAPPFKKKEKADAVTVAEGEELDPILDEMIVEGDEGVDLEGEDLTLDDLEGLDDGVEEMPEATASEGEDGEGEDDSEEESSDDAGEGEGDSEEESSEDGEDSEEESSEDGEDEGEDDSEEESAPTQATARMKIVASNLAALDRLKKSAGKKPAAK